MHYLLVGPGDYWWTNDPQSSILSALIRKGHTDLTGLDTKQWNWSRPSPAVGDEAYMAIGDVNIQVALRTGYLCPSGILVSAEEFAPIRQAAQLKSMHARTQASRPEAIRQAHEIDPSYPGFLKSLTADLGELDDNYQTLVDRQIKSIEKTLASPIKSDIADYWKSKGGFVA